MISVLAFDFGASSGRAVVCNFDGMKIELDEVYRFTNEPVYLGGHLYWDFLKLFSELKKGIKKAQAKYDNIASIGIDTWGVDYGLIDKNNNLLSNPIHYRDIRTENIINDVEKFVSFEEIYSVTGIQLIEFNTINQLFTDLKYRSNILKEADALLFMPDLFNFFLTGKKYNEYSIASTSEMIDAKSKKWSYEIIEKLSLPTNILQDIVMPGEIIGNLNEEIQRELEVNAISVVAVGSHDTASAVAGTPLKGENCAYLSCGTWSLLGIESKHPIINESSLKYNFTNEGGVEGTIRYLKNINGLWIIQQLKKSWSERVKEITFPEIIQAAKNAKNKEFIINPNDKAFLAPLNMAEEIKNYCMKNNQGTPEGLGEIAIAAYNGLTNGYKNTINDIEKTTGKDIEVLHMVGGGIQDELLCQLTANRTGKKVVAGPIEASVLGNTIMQLKALGKIETLSEGRKIIENSFKIKEYLPVK